MNSRPSIALVHDYLLVLRGAERTFAVMADCFPDAPIYTLLYDAEATYPEFNGRRIRTSKLQRTGVRQKNFRRLLPVLPIAAQRMAINRADVVISSSSAFAHGVKTRDDAVHICYCHSPFRYAWHERGRALDEAPAPIRPALSGVLGGIRRWDRWRAANVTHFIANSKITQRRIADFWGLPSTVVHPPVAVERFKPGVAEDFFLFVGEIVRHKRVEVALEAAALAGVPLKVVGTGPELERLEALYGDRAEFLRRVDDDELDSLYTRCRALIVPNVEEFGITAVEAQAAGRPVVAAAAGGSLETVVRGITGMHFPVDDVDALAEILAYTDFDRFDPGITHLRAQSFSETVFKKKFTDAVRDTVRRESGRELPPEWDPLYGEPAVPDSVPVG